LSAPLYPEIIRSNHSSFNRGHPQKEDAMTIPVQCLECDHEWDEAASKIGRRVACPECGETVRVERPGRNGGNRKPVKTADPTLARTLLIGGSVLLVGIIAMLGVRMASITSGDSDGGDLPIAATDPQTDDLESKIPVTAPAVTVPPESATEPGAIAIPPENTAVQVTHTNEEATETTSAGVRNAMHTDRGRELMAAMNDIGLRVTGFSADLRGAVAEAVEGAVGAAIEQCKLGVRPPTTEPLMLVELQLRDGNLVMSAQLIAKENQQQVKVWERSGTVTELSDQAMSAGILPPNLKRDVKTFFTSLRAEFNDARRQFSL